MATNVPRPSFTATGFIAPSEADIRTGVFADWNAAFGGALNPDSSTPQGQVIDAETAMLGGNNDLFVYYASQVDPQFASGRMQDALGRIYFITREPATPTVVTATLTGATGTVIPIGSFAQASDGSIFASLSAVTIPIGGSISVDFAAVVYGPVACPAHALNTVYLAIPGWDSVDNPADGIPGSNEETRLEFEQRRAATVEGNAVGILGAIRGSVLNNVPGIIDAYTAENSTGSPLTIGGVSLAAHSLYVSVVGGSDTDVADAIWRKKAPGCDYTGTTSITVYDTTYPLPYPSYTVKFTRAASVPIYFAVSITSSTSVPADAITQVQNAIIAAFSGDDSGPRAHIGGTVYASRFYAPIAALGAWARNIISINIDTTSSPTDTEVALNINQFPVTDVAHISVTLV